MSVFFNNLAEQLKLGLVINTHTRRDEDKVVDDGLCLIGK